MIRFVKMQNFRGIRTGKLRALTPLVVLVGPNSSGKSTILDALFIGGASSVHEAVTRASKRRRAVGNQNSGNHNPNGDRPSLFFKSERFADIIVSTGTGSRRIVLKNGGTENSPFVSTSPTPTLEGAQATSEEFAKNLARRSPDIALPEVVETGLVDARDLSGARTLEELYTGISQRGLRKEVKGFITELLPDVDDLEILAPQNVPTLHLNFDDHAVPIGLTGDGVQVLLRIVMALTAVSGTTLLLEEPETHMHPGAMRLIARAIHAAVAKGVQVVLTTHSLELIDALTLGRANDELSRLSVFRLALERGELKSTRLDGQEVALSRSAIEDDLR